MASILVFITFVTLLFSPTICLSSPKTGFQVALKHVDSNGNFTKSELMQRAIKRGRKRMEKLHELIHSVSNISNISAHIHAGEGEFLMDLSIGTPPLPFSAILDTGSDLIWTQCKPCKKCFNQQTLIFDPKNSSSFSNIPCSSDLCKALSRSKCTKGNCEYLYVYGDSSMTQGLMGYETFTFENVSVPKLGFGCGYDNEGDFQGSGLVGLGRGPLSLVSQLNEPRFSYCLTSFGSNITSTLFIGSLNTNTNTNTNTTSFKLTTPLIKIPQFSFYIVSLIGITIGETLIPIKNSSFGLNKTHGSPNMIVDSGTTFTKIEQNGFDRVKEEFAKQIKLEVLEGDFGLCLTLPPDGESFEVPKFTFNFEGADLELPVENYFLTNSNKGVGCLAMGYSYLDHGLSILGNVQQQNILVVYDLVKESLSFEPTQCDQL